MKKSVLFVLLFCGISLVTNAQLTLTGTGQQWVDSQAGTTYNLIAASAATPPWTKDAGTNVYAWTHGTFAGFGGLVTEYLIRIGGYWYVNEYASLTTGLITNTNYKYILPSTAIDPPCYAATTLGTGTTVGPAISMTGIGCSGVPAPMFRSAVITPESVTLPRLTTAEIAAIVSPTSGMMVFDINALKIKVYNGFAWKSVSLL